MSAARADFEAFQGYEQNGNGNGYQDDRYHHEHEYDEEEIDFEPQNGYEDTNLPALAAMPVPVKIEENVKPVKNSERSVVLVTKYIWIRAASINYFSTNFLTPPL